MFRKAIGFLGAVLFLSGCSGIDITQKAYDTSEDAKEEGYVFYSPKPLLVMTCSVDEKGKIGYSNTLKMVPDFTKAFTLNIRNRLGSNKATINFTDGWMLTSIGSEYTPPTSTIDKLVDIADAGIGAFRKDDEPDKPDAGESSRTVKCENFICDMSKAGDYKNFYSEACTVTSITEVAVRINVKANDNSGAGGSMAIPRQPGATM